MAVLTILNRISIAEICVYTPFLLIALLLSSRHGFGRNAGWLYLILFSVIRILGSALALATLNDPTNVGLATGAATLQTIGLSPLILTMLGLLGRVLESVRHNRKTLLDPRALRFVQTLVLVGLVLGIVGGVRFGSDAAAAATRAARGGGYVAPAIRTESKAGLGLMVAGYAILAVATVLVGAQVRAAEPGEKRLLGAVAAALPFVLVRLVYSCIGTFGGPDANFRALGAGGAGPLYADYFLGMAVIMEMAAVAVIEGVGLTLRAVPKGERTTFAQSVPLGRMRAARRVDAHKAGEHRGYAHEQESGVSRV